VFKSRTSEGFDSRTNIFLMSDSRFCTHINKHSILPLYLIKNKVRTITVNDMHYMQRINCDERLQTIGSNAEKRNGAMLPNTIRAFVCNKINVLISIESLHGVRFENVYVYSKSCNSRNINIWRICCHRSMKSTILRSLMTVMSFPSKANQT